MTRFDWQAYDDGSMDVATRAQAEQALATSDQARRELEQLRAFRVQLREAAMAEPVPVERLQARLQVVVRPGRPARAYRVATWTAGLAAAACLAVVFVLARAPRIDEVSTPAVAIETTVHEPRAVRDWLASGTGLPVPEIRLAGLDASIAGASHGKDWIAWKVTMCGDEYVIYGRESNNWFDHATEIQTGLKPMYVDGKHVGWYCGMGMAYIVKGGTEEGRLQLAKRACMETPSAVKMSQSPAERT